MAGRDNFLVSLKGKEGQVHVHIDNIAYLQEKTITEKKDKTEVLVNITEIHLVGGGSVEVYEQVPAIVQKATTYGTMKLMG